jgi:RNA polymerase sigma factor (sigma-70 family)
MNQWTEAEQYMLDQIRRGSGEAWSQFVDRYQGRLIAFARRRVPRNADPEDVVQDAFLGFLQGLNGFRQQASLETFLFVILRRRLAELHRGRRISVCSLAESDDDGAAPLAAADLTASGYVRRDEQRDAARSALADALRTLIGRMHADLALRDLQIIEMLFYAQWPNPRIAAALGLDSNYVALLKHRWLKELRHAVAPRFGAGPGDGAAFFDSPGALDSLLTQTWEDQRPSCPKRSTIGGFVLGTLDEPWQQYIDFHINRMGCSFCRANVEDLQEQTRLDAPALLNRILQSTVGFLKKA